MRPTYDAEADVFYLRFADSVIVESEEVTQDVILDLDADGRIVGIEFLAASRRLAKGSI